MRSEIMAIPLSSLSMRPGILASGRPAKATIRVYAPHRTRVRRVIPAPMMGGANFPAYLMLADGCGVPRNQGPHRQEAQ